MSFSTFMKPNVILLVDADGDSFGFVLEAAARTGHGVRLTTTSPDALKVLKSDFGGIDALVIDADSGADGLPLLADMSGCKQRLPLVVLCAAEAYMKTIVARHRTAACVIKPLSIEQLRSTLDRVLIEAYEATLIGQQIEILAAGPGSLDSACPLLNCESSAWDWPVPAVRHGAHRQQFTLVSDKHEHHVGTGSAN